jgi:hypothetical protein
MLRNRLPALFAILLAACHRSKPEAAADAGSADASAPPPSASAAEIPSPPVADPVDAPDDPGPAPPAAEVVRSALRKLESDKPLALQEQLLRDHFGGKVPLPLSMQTAPIAGGGRAVMLLAAGKDRKPFILVFDAAGTVLWTKERPLAGIAPGVAEMVMIPTARGDVMLSWFDAPSGFVAARRWDDHGNILVDYPMFSLDACEAISGLHWPGHGFLVVASGRDGARAQLLDTAGRLTWGEGGEPLPWPSRASAPVSIAVDTADSVILFQAGIAAQSKAGAPLDHVLAARYDARGKPLWARPLVVGPLASAATDRIAVSVSDGIVTVPRLSVQITSSGAVVNITAHGKHP